MKGTGKFITTVLLLSVFVIGLALLFFFPDRMDQYLNLCKFVVPMILLIMGGVAGKSIAQIIKGEKTIEEVTGIDIAKPEEPKVTP